jgi:hypothetical protein
MRNTIGWPSAVLASFAVACGLGIAGARAEQATDRTNELKSLDEKGGADKDRAAAFVREHRNDIAFIKGKLGSGSGFIALMKGRKVLITNAHVIAGLKAASFELLDRSRLRVGAASVAVGHDLIACVIVEGGTGMPMATEVETEAAIGDSVVVLGNAAGAGVVNTLQGEVVGIGPDRIEISAPFELGNSGSPIIHLKSGKVIGVATYAKLDSLLSGGEKLRRFGYRLDSVKTWQLIDWGRFYAENDLAEKLQTATLELDDIFTDFRNVRMRNTSRTYETPAIRTALDDFYSLKANHSGDTEGATRGLLVSLREACKSDIAAAKGHFSYDYFRRQLEANEIARTEFIEAIDKALRTPP